MPLSVIKKMDMGDMKPTNVYLQLADRSVKHAISVLEDVPLELESIMCRLTLL